eukprot:COSAG06_NODE_41622_length_389_cov_1.075862_1_plen_108_part_10
MCAFARCVRVQAWATGRTDSGQLGLGDTTDRSAPEQVLSATNIVQVAAGAFHTVLLDGSGLVRAILLLLSVACHREHEWCLFVCGLASFVALLASRGVCWGAGESLSR